MQNCPDITAFNSLFVICLFVFKSFCPLWSNVWRVSSLKSHSLCPKKLTVTQQGYRKTSKHGFNRYHAWWFIIDEWQLICYNVMFRPTYSYLPSVRLHAIAADLLYEKQKTFLYENSASICWMRALSDALNEGTGQSQSRFLPGRKIYSIQKNSKYLFNPKLQYLWTAHKGRAF